jgi:hypothetical protein
LHLRNFIITKKQSLDAVAFCDKYRTRLVIVLKGKSGNTIWKTTNE